MGRRAAQWHVARQLTRPRARLGWSLLAASSLARFVSGNVWSVWIIDHGNRSTWWLAILIAIFQLLGVAALLAFPSAPRRPQDRLLFWAIAIAESAAQHLDLLVTDMMMPEVPRGEVIARFRVLRPGVPIVVVTGFAALQEQDESLGGQVSAILAKPFSGSALVQAVAEALGAARLAES